MCMVIWMSTGVHATAHMSWSEDNFRYGSSSPILFEVQPLPHWSGAAVEASSVLLCPLPRVGMLGEQPCALLV